MSNNKEIKNLIENKRVCIVGPANYLNSLNIGDKIDNYDTIVRFNKGYNLIKNPDIFGSRTDILYHCVSQNIDDGGPITEEMVKQYQIVFSFPLLTTSDNSSFNKGNINEYNKLPKFISKINKINKDNYLKWENNIGCRPNTGIIALLDVLNMKPKELYITGFTLFKDGYSKLYRDKIDNKAVTEENSKFKVLDRMFNAGYKGAHDQYLIYLYLKKHVLNKDNVKMDKILIDILNFDEKKYSQNNKLDNLSSRELFIHYLYND
jgi:hypothetical protein